MATPQLEALSVANNISANTSKAQYNKTKNQLQKGEIGIKKAQLLGSLPSSTDVAGDTMMGAANSMAQSPRNGMTGLVEGLLRAFGGGLKGKAADERRQQIMDSLDVLDYTMQGEEYLKNTQQQVAKQQEDMQYRPSQKQYEQSYSDGTLEPTLKATFQQMGVDPNNVQLSSDGLNVFVEKDGQVTKAPVSDFFSPEDSQKFQFINSTQKANLAKSENKQVQGLAQENNALKSRLQTLEEQFSQMEGISPVMAKSLSQSVLEGEKMQQQEQDFKEKGLSLQERGLGIQQQNANISQDYLNLEKNKVKAQSAENSYGSIPISNLGGKGITPFTNAIKSEQNLSSEIPQVFKQLADAKKIINDNPNIGSGWANLVGSNSITRSALGDKDRAAYEKLDKISNRVAEAFIRAKGGNISDSERETIKKGLFDVSQSAESKLYNIQSVEDELSKAYLRGQFAGEELRKGLIYTPQGFEKSLEENPQALENVRRKFNLDSSNKDMVTVVNPQGISGKMPKANLQKALKSGYQVAQ